MAQGNKKKKPFFKRWWFWLIVIILIIIIASSGGDDAEKGPKKVDNDNKEESKKSDEEEIEDTEFAVGEKVKLDGQIVEVTEVAKSQGDDFDKPSEGKEYVIVHISIQNEGEDEISYNPYNFKMKNSNGQIEDPGLIIVDSDTSLSSGDLAPGGNVSGTLAFEQEKDDDALELIFEPSFWGTDEIIFNLSE